MDEKIIYEPPKVELLEVWVERGFAVSDEYGGGDDVGSNPIVPW